MLTRRRARAVLVAALTEATLIAALLSVPCHARAELDTGACFAGKLEAWGKLRPCERGEDAGAALGGPADRARCRTRLDASLARTSAGR